MNKGKPYTDADLQVIRRMWVGGYTDADINMALGRSSKSIAECRKMRGWVARGPNKPKNEPISFREDIERARQTRTASDRLLARLLAVHPEGYQDGPVKQVRRVRYQTITGLPVLQSCLS